MHFPARLPPRRAAGLTVIAALLRATLALADEALPEPAAQSPEALLVRAQDECSHGAFDACSRLYLLAYDKSAKASFVYLAARAQEDGGHAAEALRLYRHYIDVATTTDATAPAEARIRQIEAALAAAPSPAGAGTTAAAAPNKAEEPAAPTPSSGVTRTEAWLVSGAALAAVGAGALVFRSGTQAASRANAMNHETEAEDALYRSAYRGATARWQAGTALTGVGILGVAVSLWLHLQVPKAPVVALRPTAWPGGGGIACAATW